MSRHDDSAVMEKFEFLDAVGSWSRDAHGITLRCGPAAVRIEPVEAGIIRVRAFSGPEPPDEDPTGALAPEQPQAPNFTIIESEGGLKLSIESMRLAVRFDPLEIKALTPDGDAFCADAPGRGIGFAGQEVRCVKAARSAEAYYGFGEKTGPLNKRGRRMVMYNVEPLGYGINADPIYQSHPFFICSAPGAPAYGVFFDNAWKSYFDMGSESSTAYWFGAAGGELNYYILAGPGVADVVARYTLLVGRTPLPPKWALGHHQSRWSYHTEAEALGVASRFREKDIPNDAIHLDINYMHGYRVFTWHPVNFPNPERMLRELDATGTRVVCIIDPGVKVDKDYEVYREGVRNDFFVKNADGSEYHGNVWPGTTAFPDFTRDDVRKWWGERHRPLLGAGVAGIWNDMNEPAHQIPAFNRNLFRDMSPKNAVFRDGGKNTGILKNRNRYALMEVMATRDGMLEARPGQRPFILTRSGFSGVGRLAAVWTGDNFSRWSHLAMSIPMLCNLGLSGIAHCGPDIGGFTMNCTAELYARWVQLGAFYPYCRTHTMRWTRSQEPWSFGPGVEAVAREHLKLRYALMPYIYTAFKAAEDTGAPYFRPLVYDFPDDPECAGIETQVMAGPWLMLAPVLGPGVRSRPVYLPEGLWYEYGTARRHRGPAWIEAAAPLEKMPVFVRGGAVIPGAAPGRNAYETADPHIRLHIYPDSRMRARGELYEDDGISFEYRAGGFARTGFELEPAGGGLALHVLEREGGFETPQRSLEFAVHGVERPDSIRLRGEPLAAWEHHGERLEFPVPDTGETFTVELRSRSRARE